jgi:PAS domain S-box-containing protein
MSRDRDPRREPVERGDDRRSHKSREWLRNGLTGKRADASVKILLVDDQPANLQALEATLDQSDYDLVTARSGEEALKRLLDGDFALIILDVMMPGMDGYEVASLIKQRERSRHVPIIFLTATGQDLASLYRSYAAGAVDCLTKPGDPDVLRAKVAVFAELYRKSVELRAKEDQLRRLAVEEEQRQGEERVRDLADTIQQIVWTADAQGRLRYINGYGRAYLGLEGRDVNAVAPMEYVHANDRETLQTLWHRAIDEGSPFSAEARLLRASDGAYRWHLCRGGPERGDGLRGWLGTLTDIEDQKGSEARARFLSEAAKQLQASELDRTSIVTRLVKLLVPGLAEIALVDTVGDGGALERQASAFADDGMRARLDELDRRWPETREAPRFRFQAMIAGRAARWTRLREGELAQVAASPEHLTELERLGVGSIVCAPLEVLGEVSSVLTLVRTRAEAFDDDDLELATDLAHRAGMAVSNSQLYEQAQQSIRARDEFLTIAAHELKTPLTSLKLQVQALERRAHDDETRRRTGMASRAIARLARLVDVVMDVSRIGGGQLSIERAPFDLSLLAREVIARMGDDAARVGSAIALSAEAPVEGAWDRLLIEEVLENLLANAVKYGAGQPIDVDVTRRDGHARVTVRDHGIGIAAGEQQRIFDRYARAVSERNYGGLGLGLFIAREVVEAHGGTIGVESAPGAGAAFTVELPIS